MKAFDDSFMSKIEVCHCWLAQQCYFKFINVMKVWSSILFPLVLDCGLVVCTSETHRGFLPDGGDELESPHEHEPS